MFEVKHISKQQIVDELGWSPNKIDNWIKRGIVPAPSHKIEGLEKPKYTVAEAIKIVEFARAVKKPKNQMLEFNPVKGGQCQKKK